MRHLRLAFMIALLVGSAGTSALAQSFDLDSSHAQVGFRVQHFGVSYLRGMFGDVSGSMVYAEDPKDMSVEINVNTASLITSFPTRTEHAMSENFLGVEEHPTLTFKSTSFEKKGDGFAVTGDLTIRGTTKQVTFPFSMIGPRPGPFGNTRLGVTGALEINRLEYGVPFSRKMKDGVPLVGEMVEIDISVEFIQKK